MSRLPTYTRATSNLADTRSLASETNDPDALHLYAYIEYQVGDYEQAARILERLIRRSADEAAYPFDLGLSYWALGNSAKSLDAFRQAAEIDPQFGDARYNAALVTASLGDRRAGIAGLFAALRVSPLLLPRVLTGMLRIARGAPTSLLARYGWRVPTRDFPAVRDAIGFGLMQRGEFERAEAELRSALVLEQTPRRHAALGTVLDKMKRFGEAREQFEIAFKMDTFSREAAERVGRALNREQRFGEARSYFERAVAEEPRALFSLSELLALDCVEGRLVSAEDRYKRLVRGVTRSGIPALDLDSLAAIAYQSIVWALPAQQMHELARAIDEQVTRLARQRTRTFPLVPATKRTDTRLRIGYLSAKFARGTAEAAVDVIAAHDRSRFEVHVFDASRDSAESRARLSGAAEHYHGVAGGMGEIAGFISSRKLDLLIYLDGYADPQLMQVIALRPARYHAFWLGHAGRCGLRSIDFAIADAIVAPPSEDDRDEQQVIRLPGSMTHALPRSLPEPQTRSQVGLPETGVVFCAFAEPQELRLSFFESWMRILSAVEGSVLLLKGNGSAIDELRKLATTKGVAAERLVFTDPGADRMQLLAQLRHSDLFLDTEAHSTASDVLGALQAGVPALTIQGDRFATRITASCLHAVGLAELACASAADYEARAISLATTSSTLQELRSRLAASRETSALFKPDKFCRELEQALAAMLAERAALAGDSNAPAEGVSAS